MKKIINIIENKPFCATAFPFLAGMGVIVSFLNETAVIFAGLFSVFFIALYFFANKKSIYIFISAGILLATLTGAVVTSKVKRAKELSGKNISVSGVVSFSGENFCDLKTGEYKMRISNLGYEEGSTVSIVGKAEFNESQSGINDGILLLVSPLSTVKTGNDIFYSLIGKIRQKSNEKILDFPNSGFANAILTGNTDSIPENIRSDMTKSGTGHLVAISGLHTSIILSLFMAFITLFPFPVRIRRLLFVFCGLFFSAVTGFSPSVIRCALMVASANFGKGLGRKVHPVYSLFISAVIIVVFQPFAVKDVSFIMSFVAVFALITVSGPISKLIYEISNEHKEKSRYIRLIKYASLYVAAGFVSAFTVVCELSVCALFSFGEAVPFSFTANMIVIPLFTPVIFFGFVALVISFFGQGFLYVSALKIYSVFSDILLFTVKKFAEAGISITFPEKTATVLGICGVINLIFIYSAGMKLKNVLLDFGAWTVIVAVCGFFFGEYA